MMDDYNGRGIWCITGRWSGPANPAGDWTSVCHREYTSSPKFAEAVARLGFIRFTDGTSLYLDVKRKGRGKREPERNGYGKLIRDCLYQGVNSVEQLNALNAKLRSSE